MLLPLPDRLKSPLKENELQSMKKEKINPQSNFQFSGVAAVVGKYTTTSSILPKSEKSRINTNSVKS
jgi:hypothetical protein